MAIPNYKDDWVNNPKTWTVLGAGPDMPAGATLKFTGDGTDGSKGTLTVTPKGGSAVSPPWSEDCVYESADLVTLTHNKVGHTIKRDPDSHTLNFDPKGGLVAGYGASWTATEG